MISATSQISQLCLLVTGCNSVLFHLKACVEYFQSKGESFLGFLQRLNKTSVCVIRNWKIHRIRHNFNLPVPTSMANVQEGIWVWQNHHKYNLQQLTKVLCCVFVASRQGRENGCNHLVSIIIHYTQKHEVISTLNKKEGFELLLFTSITKKFHGW